MGPHRHCRAVPTHLGAFQNSRLALDAPAGTGTRFCHHPSSSHSILLAPLGGSVSELCALHLRPLLPPAVPSSRHGFVAGQKAEEKRAARARRLDGGDSQQTGTGRLFHRGRLGRSVVVRASSEQVHPQPACPVSRLGPPVSPSSHLARSSTLCPRHGPATNSLKPSLLRPPPRCPSPISPRLSQDD